jgi:hypothetical protein
MTPVFATTLLLRLATPGGCQLDDGSGAAPLDVTAASPFLDALFDGVGPLSPGVLRRTNGAYSGELSALENGRHRLVILNDEALQVIGELDADGPRGHWVFFDSNGVPTWSVLLHERRVEVKLSPCRSGTSAFAAFQRPSRTWSFGCNDSAGRREGRYELRSIAGTSLGEGLFVAGKEQGLWRSRYANGCLLELATYSAGVLDGPYTAWAVDGSVLRRGRFVRGEKVGTWRGAPCGIERERIYPMVDDNDGCFP